MDRGNTIGARIQRLREERIPKLTQAELAKEMGVRRETVNQWESNTRELKPDRTIALAKFFNVTCDYILTGVHAENIDTARKTGLTQAAIDGLEIISNIKSEFRRDRLQRVINGILSNAAFYSHVLQHATNAIAIISGDSAAGFGEHQEPPNDIKEQVEKAKMLIDMANFTGHTNYIVVDAKTVTDMQIQNAVDAFKAILQHIVEKEEK